MAVKYRAFFLSTEGEHWRIDIYDTAFSGDIIEFSVVNGFELTYRAEGQDINSPILGSTVRFGMLVENDEMKQLAEDMANAAESRFLVAIFKTDEYVFNWCGIINGGDSEVEDVAYPYAFAVSAVDGLAFLKKYEYRGVLAPPLPKWEVRYTGFSRLTTIISRCLQKMPHISVFEDLFDLFAVTSVNTYSDEMTIDATADPLYLSQVDNLAFAAGQSSANAKYKSCYDVLKEILLVFGARIMHTNGYYLIEDIEARSEAYIDDVAVRKYESIDLDTPLEHSLPGVQDISASGDFRRLSGGSWSFLPPMKAVRPKQNINAARNILQGFVWDTDNNDDEEVGGVFFDNDLAGLKFNANIEATLTNIDIPVPVPLPVFAIFRLLVKITEPGATERWLSRPIDFSPTPTPGAQTWELAESFVDISVMFELRPSITELVQSLGIDMFFGKPADVDFADMEVNFEFVGLYLPGEEEIDSDNYTISWALQDPYMSVLKKLNGATYRDVVFDVRSAENNSGEMEFPVLLGSRLSGVVNQIGGLVYNEDEPVHMEGWAYLGDGEARPLVQVLGERLLFLQHSARRVLRCTVYGTGFEWRDPVSDGETTYVLRSGTFNAARDEFNGEWMEARVGAVESSVAQEVDDGTTGGSGGGGGSPSNGTLGNGVGGGGTTGGGIYGGSGNVPDGTLATMNGDFTFDNTSASAGEAFSVVIDDGSNSSTIKAQATDGILLQATGTDDIEINGITRLTDIITSASLGSDQNDYAGLDGANVGRVTASTAVNITGIASGADGRILAVHNVGSNPVTLVNASGSSTAANRFDIGEDYTVRASHGVLLQYDSTASRWRIVAADRLGRFTEAYTTSTATTASLTATSPATNVNVAIVPKGTGGILADVPDGASTGGNARGTNAVDLQTDRNNAAQVASGTSSVVVGGARNTASAQYSSALGGYTCTASGNGSVAMGGNSGLGSGVTASGTSSFAFGTGASATATNAIALNADASAQNAVAINSTLASGADKYGQVSIGGLNHLHLSEITLGTGAQELFLDGNGGSLRATIPADSTWIAEVRVFAKVSSPGDGTVVPGEIYAATYKCVIANKGGTTALVGTVQADMAAQTDASVALGTFTIAADNTNDALTVTYNSGAFEGTNAQIAVKATIWYNEF